MDAFKSIVGIILIFIFFNLFLWGGQELYWREETQEINKIESYLKDEKSQISSLQEIIDNQSAWLDKKKYSLIA